MENPADQDDASQKTAGQRRPFTTPQMMILMVAVFVVLFWWITSAATRRSEISYPFFLQQIDANNVKELTFVGEFELHGKFAKAPRDPNPNNKDSKGQLPTLQEDFQVLMPPLEDRNLLAKLLEKKIDYEVERNSDTAGMMLLYLNFLVLPLLIIGFIYFMLRRTRDQMMSGGGILGNFAKSPARRYEPDGERITFKDVAGLESVKQELEELVEFLKNPLKFQRLGGRIPKGTLLMGPPGTGKTLLAKAVAGEANVPFYSINGSEFIQMFVGVGAGRVRDMFKTAKQNSPCILFIDEIDAVGRIRGAGFGGGHDEREQTLNQILSEMDGFSPSDAVIVVAATNRPDVLDPALLRPGRFDRHVTVDRPSLKGRVAILKVHTRKVPLSDDVDLERLAGGLVGMTGADLRNLVNEAALWATRENKNMVDMSDFEYARDKVLMGPKRDEVLNEKEKLLTAYHEAGHALLAWLLPGVDRVHKVSVIPRGRALGVTQLMPDEDRMNISEDSLHARLAFMLGGRAAERLVFHQHSAGAEDDLKRATSIARRMVTHWGMSERLGPVAFRSSEEHPFLGKEITEQRDFSDHTARVIDEEVARILHHADDQARDLLEKNRDLLDKLTHGLVASETLEEIEIEALIGPSVNKRRVAPSTNGSPQDETPTPAKEAPDSKPES